VNTAFGLGLGFVFGFGLAFGFGLGFALGVGFSTVTLEAAAAGGAGGAAAGGLDGVLGGGVSPPPPPPPLLLLLLTPTTTETGPALTEVLFGPLPVTDAVFVYDDPSVVASLCEHVNTRDSFGCSDCGPDGESVPESHFGSFSVTDVSGV
jgi:hypothetical protein